MRFIGCALFIAILLIFQASAQETTKPFPDLNDLMHKLEEHQKEVEKIRENYSFSVKIDEEESDGKGKVKNIYHNGWDCFYVNGHAICKKTIEHGLPLTAERTSEENHRVLKEIHKAEKHHQDEHLIAGMAPLSEILDVMHLENPRWTTFRDRSMLMLDLSGQKDAHAHGLEEQALKSIRGTIWVDEEDLEIAKADFLFYEDAHLLGFLAKISKGTKVSFEQERKEPGLWMLTREEATMAGKFLGAGGGDHWIEVDSDFKKFHIDAEQIKAMDKVK